MVKDTTIIAPYGTLEVKTFEEGEFAAFLKAFEDIKPPNTFRSQRNSTNGDVSCRDHYWYFLDGMGRGSTRRVVYEYMQTVQSQDGAKIQLPSQVSDLISAATLHGIRKYWGHIGHDDRGQTHEMFSLPRILAGNGKALARERRSWFDHTMSNLAIKDARVYVDLKELYDENIGNGSIDVVDDYRRIVRVVDLAKEHTFLSGLKTPSNGDWNEEERRDYEDALIGSLGPFAQQGAKIINMTDGVRSGEVQDRLFMHTWGD